MKSRRTNGQYRSNDEVRVGLWITAIAMGAVLLLPFIFSLWAYAAEPEFISPEGAGFAQIIRQGLSVTPTPTMKPLPTVTPTPSPTATPTPIPTLSNLPNSHIEGIIRDVFGKYADKGIKMLRTCENSTLNPHAINKANKNKTWDVGVWQINVDPNDKEEIERLKDPVYNTKRAWKDKFVPHNHTFYLWTCGYAVGDYTYVDARRDRNR